MFINRSASEINLRIVFFGLDYSGRATTLQFIHDHVPPTTRGKMISVQSETERTIFFDLTPEGLGQVHGFTIRLHLYALTGPSKYEASDLLILKGVDGVVFVADSQEERIEANLMMCDRLDHHLRELGLEPAKVPRVYQLNKRSFENAAPTAVLMDALPVESWPCIETDAKAGEGVFAVLEAITKELLLALKEDRLVEAKLTPEEKQAAIDFSARAQVVGHLGEFFGNASEEYWPASALAGRPEFIVVEHPPTQSRTYWSYGTAGLALRPQAPGGPEPHLELVAYSPQKDRRLVDVLMALAHQIAAGEVDDQPFKTYDTVDLSGLGLIHSQFVLAPPPEDPLFMTFPDPQADRGHEFFNLAVAGELDSEIRVTFCHVVPLTGSQMDRAQQEGSRVVLADLAREGGAKSAGWPFEPPKKKSWWRRG